ncbi:uncharacterized protein [Dysidea avara]|uniref:uncharacterized protein isoform X1 n=1 Tax=Dysidea avara TaxID=196820 RepID=UPI0033312C9E
MDENTVVDQLFYSDTDDDWNNSDEEDSFVHGEDSFVLDRLTREQDDDYGDVEENDREEVFSKDEEDIEEETNDDYEADVRYCEGHDESSHPGPSGLHSGVSDGGMGSLETEYPCSGSPVAYHGSPVSSSLRSRSSSPHAPFSPSDRGRDYSPSPSDPLSGRNRGRGRGRGRGTASPMDLVPSRGRRKGTGRGRGTSRGRDLAIDNAYTLECCFTPVNDCRPSKALGSNWLLNFYLNIAHSSMEDVNHRLFHLNGLRGLRNAIS